MLVLHLTTIGTVLTCSTDSCMTASQLSGALTCATCTDEEPEAEQTGRSTGADQQCQALTQKGLQCERKPYRGSLCGVHRNKDVQLVQARHSADALAVKEADNAQQEAGEQPPACAKKVTPAADAQDKQASAKSLKAVVRITADENCSQHRTLSLQAIRLRDSLQSKLRAAALGQMGNAGL